MKWLTKHTINPILLMGKKYKYPKDIISLISYICMSHSELLVYVAAIIISIYHSNLISFIILFSMFCYSIIDSPLPSSKYWIFLMEFIWIVFITNYTYQLPLFCQMIKDNQYYPSIYVYNLYYYYYYYSHIVPLQLYQMV